MGGEFCWTTWLDVLNFPQGELEQMGWTAKAQTSAWPPSPNPSGNVFSQSHSYTCPLLTATGGSRQEGRGESVRGWCDGATKCPRSQIRGQTMWSSALYLTFNQSSGCLITSCGGAYKHSGLQTWLSWPPLFQQSKFPHIPPSLCSSPSAHHHAVIPIILHPQRRPLITRPSPYSFF